MPTDDDRLTFNTAYGRSAASWDAGVTGSNAIFADPNNQQPVVVLPQRRSVSRGLEPVPIGHWQQPRRL